MNQGRRVLIPAILVAFVSVLLVIYSYYTMPLHPQGSPAGVHPPAGSHTGIPPREGKNHFDFTILGNIAIFCGVFSYWWFLFKKKLTSPSQSLKKMSKRIYSLHTYTGWIALVLIIIHGGYYLITDLHHPKLLTGVAAFILLLGLAIYGWLYKRVRNKYLRTSHFILSNVWFMALLIHAGGFFILMVVVTFVLWAVIGIMDWSAKKAA
ncbi:hypothetical protein DNHGIG_19080 [Collibacillus ludicampi]|uniref:Ferric oxidoreductase domain-containing protein n=1 Tax=Collibacillus ludicampi TaxID=2771369 RepID=A0AAV4LFR7_9BACL|nr:hypothetical protein [Collibacillus ludicampi]GIM46359.1 hypothetical protein DNHGIG_19080 [Collibacillus ludicampi]